MSQSDAYLFYEAGQAVAASHLGLTIRRISGNPALQASDIQLPRNDPKVRMILWLTGLAAEKKGVGRSSPLRRMRNRQRVRSQMNAVMGELTGSPSKRQAEARCLLNQAQDRANAICGNLYDAIEILAHRLRDHAAVSGQEVDAIVASAKLGRPLGVDGKGTVV
jgi:hypothetical protein